MAHGIFVAACRLLSCGMRAGSSSPMRDQTRAPCIGSVESYPLDHQGSPSHTILNARNNNIVNRQNTSNIASSVISKCLRQEISLGAAQYIPGRLSLSITYQSLTLREMIY